MTDRRPSAPPLIRRIRPDEGPVLRALRLRSLGDSPGAFGQTMEEALARDGAEWAEMAAAGSAGDRRAWFVAVDPGAPERLPVGMVTGRRRPNGTLLVFSMWVDPEWRRTGLGGALLDAAERWGRGWGAGRTLLWVMNGNADAFAFYAALGFHRETGTEDDEAGRRVGAAVLVRPIVPDGSAATGTGQP